MIQYRRLSDDEICRSLFQSFIRRQAVKECWRKEDDHWIIRDDPFIDDWTEEDYDTLIADLRQTALADGFIYGAFFNGALKGFVSVRAGLFGGGQKYLDLSHIYVSADMRRKNIGAALFEAAKKWAREKGAERLYISAHSAVESQAFYRNLGCVEAQVYSQRHVDKEPYDCQMEYKL